MIWWVVAALRTPASAAGSLVLVFPDWANGYTLQTSATAAAGSWTTVTATRNLIDGRTVVSIPMGTTPAFFRLTR